MTERSLQCWARSAREEAASSRYGFATAHLDELVLSEPITSGPAVAHLLESAETYLEAVRGTGAVRLAIPLGDVAQLTIEPPQHMQWSSATDEPPSLYYTEPRLWQYPTDREEYRCPYEAPELESLRLVASYACGRGREARVNDWEFDRVLWVMSAGDI